MSEGIKNRMLVERFSRYIDYRKTVGKSSKSFTEQMSGDAAAPAKTMHAASQSRGARRHQPPRLGKPRQITQIQAQRLARYAPLIEGAARKHGVPVELICGVILQESGGNPKAQSPAGAAGLMQLMPATARRFGVKDSLDPAQNIEGGTAYLRFLLDKFKGNLSLAVAGYNAGEGAVEKYGNKIPPYRETQGYVPNVLGYTQSMINLFYAKLNQPELPSHARRV